LVKNAVSPGPALYSLVRTFICYKAELDLEVRDLEQQLEEERAKRGRGSEEIMHEAEQWLARFQHSVGFCVAMRNDVGTDGHVGSGLI